MISQLKDISDCPTNILNIIILSFFKLKKKIDEGTRARIKGYDYSQIKYDLCMSSLSLILTNMLRQSTRLLRLTDLFDV